PPLSGAARCRKKSLMSKNSLVPPERGDVSLLTGGLLLNKKAKLAGEGVASKQEGQLAGEGVI
ncbi:MAG: hypothetical protein IJR94_05635, partial [Synergistaceae bacterium]|nr:hypothetical protein [Synergistaceae bacterium]